MTDVSKFIDLDADTNEPLEVVSTADLMVSKYVDRTEYRVGGLLHRPDGPAWIGSDGSELWYEHGVLLRLKRSDGAEEWYINKPHQNEAGDTIYSCVLHKTDGPAVVGVSGDKYWYLNGERHREDGPAVILPWKVIMGIKSTGYTEMWFLEDIQLKDKKEHKIALGILSGELFDKIPLYINNEALKPFCERMLK